MALFSPLECSYVPISMGTELFVATILWAAATEVMSLFAPRRTLQLSDLAFDLLGVGIGTIMIIPLSRKIENRLGARRSRPSTNMDR